MGAFVDHFKQSIIIILFRDKRDQASSIVVVVHKQHVVVVLRVEVDRVLEKGPITVVNKIVFHDHVRRRTMQGYALPIPEPVAANGDD